MSSPDEADDGRTATPPTDAGATTGDVDPEQGLPSTRPVIAFDDVSAGSELAVMPRFVTGEKGTPTASTDR